MNSRPDRVGEEAGEGRLAGPRRAPQEERVEVATSDGAAERPALADEVLLAHELLEGSRPHPGRERLALRRRLEKGLGTSAGQASGWHRG